MRPLGRGPQRVPRVRQRRKRQEGNRPMVPKRGRHYLQALPVRLDLRETIDFRDIVLAVYVGA